MFKGMYDLLNKNKNKRVNEKVAIRKDAAPILSAEDLLNTEKRQKVLQDIRGLLNLPDDEYNRIFLSVIHQFAEFVQNLPATELSYYSNLGGFLEHALERAALSLFLCRTYLLPEDATLASLSEEDMLWVYAVFTAALFLDLGKIATRYVISLTDAEGNPIKAWLPYVGSMSDQGTHYVYGFNEDHYEHLGHMVTPLLARQLLPSDQADKTDKNEEGEEGGEGESQYRYGGFNWLASDPDVLASWLAMLSDDHRQVGSLLTVIPLADAQLLESYFTDRKVFRHALSPQTIALLNKLSKQRKEFSQKLKEMRDKMLGEHFDRESADKQTHEQGKTAKQSLFGFPSAGQQDKTKTAGPVTLDADNVRKTAENFSHWVKDNLDKGKLNLTQAESPIQITNQKVVMTEQLLQAYLNDNKNTTVHTMNDLRSALIQSELMRPATPADMLKIPALAGNFTHILVAQHAGVFLPQGMSLMLTSGAPTTVVQQQATPQQPTAQDAYQQQQKVQQQQQTIRDTTRPMPPGNTSRR